jgi:hypothetical protein
MKKALVLILLTMICLSFKAQELPTISASGFSFPIGTKFTIKLAPIDSINFNYSIIEFEKFDKTVDTYNHDDLFNKTGNDSTITFYFCLGTEGDNEAEKKENMKVLLLMKNYTKYMLKYTSEIQRKENGVYESTSNVGTFPGVLGNEMWPYMIYSIGLREFKKMTYEITEPIKKKHASREKKMLP